MSFGTRVILLIVATLPMGFPLSAQEPASGARVFVSAGFINSPTEFDVARAVEYSSGLRVGGGAALQLYDQLAVRADFSTTFGSGTDRTGGINEAVELDRSYAWLGMEFQFRPDEAMTPYLHGGGGIIVVDRNGATATSYNFDVTEFTGVVGGGVQYTLPSNFQVLVEATGWIYNRAADDSSQFDTSVSVGVGYRFGR